jgi:CBS domain containing-hemolysin-like protein
VSGGGHQALVVDVSGSVVGLITLEDVVGELLGGVADEFKPCRRARFDFRMGDFAYRVR